MEIVLPRALTAPPAAVASRQELFTRLRGHAPAIRRLGVRTLRLFGSFARDRQAEDSDVDLLVGFHPGEKSYARFLDLAELLEDVLRRPVELVTEEGLSPHLGPRILDEAERVPLDD